jgi:hypothetical protein
MTDGYPGYQHLLDRIDGIGQCAQHIIRRARAVQKLGPGGVQDWAGDIITILREAHAAVEDARARETPPGTLQLTAGRSAVELSRKGWAKAR